MTSQEVSKEFLAVALKYGQKGNIYVAAGVPWFIEIMFDLLSDYRRYGSIRKLLPVTDWWGSVCPFIVGIRDETYIKLRGIVNASPNSANYSGDELTSSCSSGQLGENDDGKELIIRALKKAVDAGRPSTKNAFLSPRKLSSKERLDEKRKGEDSDSSQHHHHHHLHVPTIPTRSRTPSPKRQRAKGPHTHAPHHSLTATHHSHTLSTTPTTTTTTTTTKKRKLLSAEKLHSAPPPNPKVKRTEKRQHIQVKANHFNLIADCLIYQTEFRKKVIHADPYLF